MQHKNTYTRYSNIKTLQERETIRIEMYAYFANNTTALDFMNLLLSRVYLLLLLHILYCNCNCSL